MLKDEDNAANFISIMTEIGMRNQIPAQDLTVT